MLSHDDLASFEIEWLMPVSTTYNGVEIYQLPPNNQGLIVLEALNIAQELGLSELPLNSPRRTHQLVEELKLSPQIFLLCLNIPQTAMTRHIIIVGGGRVGRHAAEQLNKERYTVTIIERDSEKCTQLTPKISQVIEGDGTNPDILKQADPTSADVVAALTNDTDVNLSICEMVHETASDTRTILRIARDGEQDYGYRDFVDQIVYPAAAGADVTVDRITSV